jgi:hypothetical protein
LRHLALSPPGIRARTLRTGGHTEPAVGEDRHRDKQEAPAVDIPRALKNVREMQTATDFKVTRFPGRGQRPGTGL